MTELKVNHFSRRGRPNSRLPIKKIKSLLQKTRKVRVLYGRVFGKIHHCMVTVIVKGHVYCWKYPPCIN